MLYNCVLLASHPKLNNDTGNYENKIRTLSLPGIKYVKSIGDFTSNEKQP